MKIERRLMRSFTSILANRPVMVAVQKIGAKLEKRSKSTNK